MSWKSKIVTEKFQNAIKNRKKICIFDVETTGLSKDKDRIVQFSAIIAEPNQYGIYQETSFLDLYIKQPVYMTQQVINIHHITNEFLEDKPMESEVVNEIYNFLKKADFISGYNIARFDIAFLDKMLGRFGIEEK